MGVARSPVKPLMFLALAVGLVAVAVRLPSQTVLSSGSTVFHAISHQAPAGNAGVSFGQASEQTQRPSAAAHAPQAAEPGSNATSPAKPIATHPEDAGPDIVGQPAVRSSACGPAPCRR